MTKGTNEDQRFEHDCPNCVFLGQYGKADLWVHPTEFQTVIARFSSEDSDYTSGLVFVPVDDDLKEAHRRAVERGLLTGQEYKRLIV